MKLRSPWTVRSLSPFAGCSSVFTDSILLPLTPGVRLPCRGIQPRTSHPRQPPDHDGFAAMAGVGWIIRRFRQSPARLRRAGSACSAESQRSRGLERKSGSTGGPGGVHRGDILVTLDRAIQLDPEYGPAYEHTVVPRHQPREARSRRGSTLRTYARFVLVLDIRLSSFGLDALLLDPGPAGSTQTAKLIDTSAAGSLAQTGVRPGRLGGLGRDGAPARTELGVGHPQPCRCAVVVDRDAAEGTLGGLPRLPRSFSGGANCSTEFAD